MASAKGTLDVDGREASWTREGRLDGRPLVIVAHGAGAPLTSPFMVAVAEGLVTRGFAAARFHFPYMEYRVRTGKKRAPDRQPVLTATWRAMLAEVSRWKGAGPVVLAGKSMGGRMASMLLAEDGETGARGAAYLGYPLHPPGKKDRLRSEHLPEVGVPQLFVQGSRDSLCDLQLLGPVLESIGASARLFVVEGADHSLARKRSAPLEGADLWLDVVAEFVKGVCLS
ncbi:MAG: alpha/beta family hydrolase [Planctomycetota bacterium]